MKMKIRKFSNGFSVRVGAFYLRYFAGEGLRFDINFSRPFWIWLFGWNARHYGV